MDIKVTSTGKIFYQVDSAVGALLCEALPSVFEHVGGRNKQQDEEHKLLNGLAVHLGLGTSDNPRQPEGWAVAALPSGKPVLQFSSLTGTARYDGPPEKAAAVFKREIPEDILALYKSRFAQSAPKMPSDDRKKRGLE